MSQYTPYYVLDLDKAAEAYTTMCRVFAPASVYYCVKACGEPGLLQHLGDAGALFEISSSGELDRVIASRVPCDRIICGLPVKSDDEVNLLSRGGVGQFVFDHPDELQRLDRLAPTTKKILRLRTGDSYAEEPFGVSLDELAAWDRLGGVPAGAIDGVTFDIRGNREIERVLVALKLCAKVLDRFGTHESDRTTILNIGGNYRLPTEVRADFYDRLLTELAYLREAYQTVVQVEIGRSVVKFAGRLVTTVILVRQRAERLDVYLDAGEPSGISHGPVSISREADAGRLKNRTPARFFGMTCGRRPLFDFDLSFLPAVGDLLVLDGMGAYTIAKQSDFHAWSRTPVYCVTTDQVKQPILPTDQVSSWNNPDN